MTRKTLDMTRKSLDVTRIDFTDSSNRRLNILVQQEKAKITNKLKGCLTHLKKKKDNKQLLLYNQLINELIETEYYTYLWDRYGNYTSSQLKDIPKKDFDILDLLDFTHPDLLIKKYKPVNFMLKNNVYTQKKTKEEEEEKENDEEEEENDEDEEKDNEKECITLFLKDPKGKSPLSISLSNKDIEMLAYKYEV